MLKKSLIFIIILSLCLSLFPAAAFAEALDLGAYLENKENLSSYSYHLPKGEYILSSDIQLDYPLQIEEEGETTIKLNGYMLDLCGNTLSVSDKSKLTIIGGGEKEHYFDYAKNAVWTISSESFGIAVENINGNAAAVKITGSVITNYPENDCSFNSINNSGSLVLQNVNIVGNLNSNGCVFNDGEAEIKGCNFYGNYSDINGTVVSNGKMVMSDCNISYNCGSKGAGIYVGNYGEEITASDSNSSGVIISDTVITNNAASVNGGGICLSEEEAECLVEGTLISMADGSVKRIEDVSDGDEVLSFDHETGKLSHERICFVYESEKPCESYTLHFTNGIELGIAGAHGLLEMQSGKYEIITEENAEQYIGKYFYNAVDDTWEELLSVTDNGCKYCYSIYSANHINTIANKMITIPDDSCWLINIFDLDEDLKIDQVKKQEDIERYGLYPIERLGENYSRQAFDDFNTEYVFIGIGKGLISRKTLLSLKDETSDYYKKETESKDSFKDNLFGVIEKSKEGEEPEYTQRLALKGTVIVKDNYLAKHKNNIYIEDGLLIDLEGIGTNSDIGIVTEATPAENASVKISSDGSKTQSLCLSSDISEYEIKFNANHFELAVKAGDEADDDSRKKTVLAAIAGGVIGAAAVGTGVLIANVINNKNSKDEQSKAKPERIDKGCKKDSSCPVNSFTDLDADKWYHDGIHYCVENGLIEGFPGNEFKPNGNITRSQLLTVIWRLAGKPASDAYAASDAENDPFNSWYIDAARWAKACGICEGRSDEIFGAGDNLTREEFADILYKFAKYCGADVYGIIASADASEYEDLLLVSEKNLPGIYYCIRTGVISGNNGRLNPEDVLTRAEASAMLQRFCEPK